MYSAHYSEFVHDLWCSYLLYTLFILAFSILLSVSVYNIISDASYAISVHLYTTVLSVSTFDVITILYLISYPSAYVCVYNIISLYVSDVIYILYIYVHLMSV